MTVRQLVREFGLNNVSESVKACGKAAPTKWIDVMHSVYPNIDRDASKLDSKNKPFKSVYYEVGGDNDKLLRESGFDEFPIMAPRWEVNGEDVYGSSCRVCWRLDLLKALQLLQKRKSQLIDKPIRRWLLRLPSESARLPSSATSRISIRLLVRMVSGLLIWLTQYSRSGSEHSGHSSNH